MPEILRRLLSPPVFADDAEKTQQARLLYTVVLFTSGVLLLVLLTLPFSDRVLPGLAVLIPLLAMGIVALALMRAGYVRPVAHAFVGFLWLATTVVVIMSGGISSSATEGYIVAIAAAGLLSGIATMAVLAGLSLLAALVIFGIESWGLLPAPWLTAAGLGGLSITLINTLLVTGLLYLALNNLRRALAHARQNEQRLADSNRELQAIRDSLAEQVTERTRVAEEARTRAETMHQALQAQVWQVTGLAQLSDVMRGEQELPALTAGILRHLCRYVEAPTGLLYLLEDETLVLAAAYAGQGWAEQTRFRLGEGALGQVAVERRPRLLAVAEPPLTVTSSFGEIALTHVVLFPLLDDERLVGVLELGRLAAFTDHQMQFLMQALERAAIAITIAQGRARINALLEETQRQAEELQAQEEELRAANEELTAQAESLRALYARARGEEG